MYNDLFDGATWTNSPETLVDNENVVIIQKTAPKIRFDFGAWCGFTDFEYVILPNVNNFGTYSVYALTNNKTILQLVGIIEFSVYNSGDFDTHGYIYFREPVENYTKYPNWVESITVDGTVYTYSRLGNHLDAIWINEQTNEEVHTDTRNPFEGGDAVKIDETGYNDYSIDAVTYYDGLEPFEQDGQPEE